MSGGHSWAPLGVVRTDPRAELVAWLDRADDAAGVHVLVGDDWVRTGYRALAARASRRADQVRAVTRGRPAVVGIARRRADDLLADFFGTVAAGAAPAVLRPPAAGERPADHLADTRARIRRGGVVMLLADDGTLPVGGFAASESENTAEIVESDPALIQFSSGTTAGPAPTALTAGQLLANIRAIAAWLQIRPGDGTATWLPPTHDMGLVGCLLTPALTGTDIWVSSPAQFLRRPLRYLDLFATRRCRLGAMPPFGLDRLLRALAPDAPVGDLSGWRALVVGAQRIPPSTLRAFERRLAPTGLGPHVLCPAYGLAEATLAVTGSAPDRPWRALPPLAGAAAAPDLVGCGEPLPGVSVSVRVDGRLAASAGGRASGEIVVRGPSVPAEPLRTGDIGLLDGGELFVLGRAGDAVNVRGRRIGADDVEVALAAGGGDLRHLAVVLGDRADGPCAIVVTDRRGTDLVAAVAIVRRVVGDVAVVPLLVRAGGIPRSMSGKVRRRKLWEAVTAGTDAVSA